MQAAPVVVDFEESGCVSPSAFVTVMEKNPSSRNRVGSWGMRRGEHVEFAAKKGFFPDLCGYELKSS